ncbi:MAG: OmpH family outer membrane protein [Alistipes sp.]|nr:OmpH family outer membrane protein [Alistipes sp.]
MRRLLLTIVAAVMAFGAASAQKYFVVDSEKIFKSIDAYNSAITELDELAKRYQAEVDAKYKSLESLYNNYMAQKHALSATVQTNIENQILKEEKSIQNFQEGIFGKEGALMKRRVELIKPIQTKVFATIETYAKANGFDLVIDKAMNTSVLYVGDAVDHTALIIEELKKQKK